MKQILIVSHCILNTAAKCRAYRMESIRAEESLRRELLHRAVDRGVQLLQLPCPELMLYGLDRWGHTRDQFDNPFFRQTCRELLKPILLQIQAYAAAENVELLGVLGIDGSPSCGVKYTCSGPWGGDFGGRDVSGVLSQVRTVSAPGILMEVLLEELARLGLTLPVDGLYAKEPGRALSLLGGEEASHG